MSHNEGKISQFMRRVRLAVVTDVPASYQACESCREPTCDSVRAATCEDRILGESQELRRRRLVENGKSGA